MTPSPLSLVAQADLLLWCSALLTGADDRSRPAPSRQEVAAAASRAGFGESSAAFEGLARLADLAAATPEERVVSERTRLFDGATDCPPNETAWVRRDKGGLLADIRGFYLAFGFDLAHGVGEKADHVVAELQFVALLLVMLARADERGDVERAQITREALSSFTRDHLDGWLGAFCDRLAATSRLALDRVLAESLGGVWELVCSSNGLARSGQPVPAEPRGDDPLEPFVCGLGPAPEAG